MRVGFFQFDVAFGKLETNLDMVAGAVAQHEFDLIVLPELFATGYLFSSRSEVQSYAEQVPDGLTTKFLIDIARRKRAYIIGGIVEREGHRVYNTAIAVGRDGLIGKHRKRHLTKFELPLFDRGESLELLRLGGVIIGVLLCFDTWFPEACRVLALRGAEIICSPANFGGPWSPDIIRARSVENMVYTISANRIGAERRDGAEAEFRGESQIIGCEGEVLARADGTECISFVDIQPDRARNKSNLLCEDLLRELEYYGRRDSYDC